jgi:hypothetical protein
MEYISPSDLRSFLDPRAFSVARASARGAVALAPDAKPITSTTTRSTLGLLLGAEQRLADMRTSLQTMLNLSIEGAQARGNERKYDAAYGKLRSLTAGFDQVLQASTFRGEQLFDGRDWKVSADGQRLDLETRDLRASGEALGLVERREGAKVTVGYDVATIIRNSNSGLRGLDIADAVGIERTDGRPELEDGKYRLEIEYNGPDSKLVFSDQFGVKIETLTNIDLTGSGIDLIKFKAGIQIKLEKLKNTIGFDKWDYEKDGPVSLHADLNYERVSWHTLAGDQNRADANAEASWTYKARKAFNAPALNFGEITANGVTPGRNELAAGDYQLRVKYRGDKSVVEVRDVNGVMKARLANVKLGPDSGTYTVDTGLGVKFTLENKDWGATEREMRATFKYEPVTGGERNFDFVGYGQRLVDAIGVIDEQLSSVSSSIEAVQGRQAMLNGRIRGNSPTTLLLGGGGTISSLLSGASVNARLQVSGMQLFSSINSGVATQGNGATNLLSFLA